MEKTITLRPYDRDVADDVYSVLFASIPGDRGDGLMPIPAASYQLVISALELVRWEVSGQDKDTLRKATGILEHLRDQQKMREWRTEQ